MSLPYLCFESLKCLPFFFCFVIFFVLQGFCFVYTFFIFLSHCLKSVGRWETALRRGTLQEACLSVGSTRGHSRWFEGRSGWFETSSTAAVNKWCCQSPLFEVLTALSANNPVTLGWSLFDGKSFGKRNVKRDVFYLFSIPLTFRKAEVNLPLCLGIRCWNHGNILEPFSASSTISATDNKVTEMSGSTHPKANGWV